METLLADFEEKRKFHSKLADFFVDHCKNVDRVLLMAPEQLKLAGEKKRLLEFLRKDARSMNRSGLWKNNYYKVTEAEMKKTNCFRCKNKLFERKSVISSFEPLG